MSIIKENIVPTLIGAALGGLGMLAASIYADLLPSLIPALSNIGAQTYAKIVLLLALLLAIVAVIALAIFLRSRPYRPRTLTGRLFGFQWSAELDYGKKQNEVEIETQWLCPKHEVFFGIKNANVPECVYHNLWCAKCGQTYEMKAAGATVYVEEAERILRRKVLGKLRLG